MQIWALILNTLREIKEKKLFWIYTGFSLVIAGAMACMGFNEKGVVFLGRYAYEHPDLSTANPLFRSMVILFLNNLVVALYVGWFGCMLGLVCTSGIIPSLLERGLADCILSRPVSRWTILLSKFAGGLTFMAVQASLFVGLTFLIVGFRWKVWLPGYLWSIPLLILLFTYLYSLCVAFGVITRSTLASLLLTLACWFFIWLVQVAHVTTHTVPQLRNWTTLQKVTDVLRWIVPKTADIPMLADKLISDHDPAEIMKAEFLQQPEVDQQAMKQSLEYEARLRKMPIYYSVGTSLLFVAVVLFLAGWRFTRLDF